MTGCATLILFGILALAWKHGRVKLNKQGGGGHDDFTPRYIRRSTTHAARVGRDYAHGNKGKKPVDWGDNGWGW